MTSASPRIGTANNRLPGPRVLALEGLHLEREPAAPAGQRAPRCPKRTMLSATHARSNGPNDGDPRREGGRSVRGRSRRRRCRRFARSRPRGPRSRRRGRPGRLRWAIGVATTAADATRPMAMPVPSPRPRGRTWLFSTAARSAAALSATTIPAPHRAVRTFCLTMQVRTAVRSAIPVPARSWTRLPVMRTCPGGDRDRPGRDDDAVAPRLVAEPVDGVAVDGRVRADDDARPVGGDLVADDVQRAAAARRRRSRRSPPERAGEHLVARDAAGVQVGGERRPGRCRGRARRRRCPRCADRRRSRPILSPAPASIAGPARRARCARSATSSADARRARPPEPPPSSGRTRGPTSSLQRRRARRCAGAPPPARRRRSRSRGSRP